MATRTASAPRPLARPIRRVLLATALACAVAAPAASAVPLTITPSFSVTPKAGQTTSCVQTILGLPLNPTIKVTTGLWGNGSFGTSTSALPLPKLVTLADSAGGQWVYCSVTVSAPLLLNPVTVAIVSPVEGIAPANKSLPSVSGTAKVGRTVKCNPGNWSAVPSSFSIKWLRNGSQVSTGRTRKLKGADAGQAIACSVVAHNRFGSSAPATSPSVSVH